MVARLQHQFSEEEGTRRGGHTTTQGRPLSRHSQGRYWMTLEATHENLARDVVLDKIGKTGMIDICENVVASGDPIRSEARVFEHENVVLWIRNDCGLILRHLNHGQALERDDSVRHYRSRKPQCFSWAPTGRRKKPLTPIRPLVCACSPVAEGEARISSWFRE